MAMMLELLDFAPFARVVDAHSLWHAATIPIALGWWTFLCNDAIELEGSMMGKAATVVDPVAPLLSSQGRGRVTQSAGTGSGSGSGVRDGVLNGTGVSTSGRGLEADLDPEDTAPRTPEYIQIATSVKRSGGRSSEKENRQD